MLVNLGFFSVLQYYFLHFFRVNPYKCCLLSHLLMYFGGTYYVDNMAPHQTAPNECMVKLFKSAFKYMQQT